MLSLQRVDIDRQDRGRVRGGGWRPNEVSLLRLGIVTVLAH
jgi:hypothetical protein